MPASNIALAANGITAYSSKIAYGTDIATKAFDANADTYWNVSHGGAAQWVACGFLAPATISAFRVNTGLRGCTSWTIDYSHDLVNWTQAHAGSSTGDSGVVNLASAITARYWRFQAVSGYQNATYLRVHDLEFHSENAAPTTILPPAYYVNEATTARGASFSASSERSGLGWFIANGFDNDIATYWGTSTATATGQWLKADLGSVKTIAGLRLIQRGDLNFVNFVPDWRIQCSTNDTDWTDAIGPRGLIDTGCLELASPTTARYWRAYANGQAWAQLYPSADTYWNICEVMLYADSSPASLSMTPTSGPIGTTVAISGTNFKASQGTGSVTFNSTTATITSWSDTEIVCVVAAGSTTGTVTVTNDAGYSASAGTFTVLWPTITLLTPNHGVRGSTVVITGTTFNDTKGDGSVKFHNNQVATTSAWADTEITGAVPMTATTGEVKVTDRYGNVSNGVVFTIDYPTISSIDPVSPTPGGTVVIGGSNFGDSQGSGGVTIGEEPAPVTSWSNTEIVVTVPPGVSEGDVVVTDNYGNVSNGYPLGMMISGNKSGWILITAWR